MSATESINFGDEVIHSGHLMRRICPSRQAVSDGFVRKLWRTCPSWDKLAMPSVDIERVKRVLVEATKDPEKLSRRGLSLAAGQSRDCVGDIIHGRNKNPTINVLMSLAEQLGGDLSLFGLSIDVANEPPTVSELEAALRDTLPDMPRGALDKRVRYLAEGVSQILRLPQSRPAIGQPNRSTAPAKGAPPPEATK